MNDLLRLAKELDLPLVATNDLHYTHQHDAQSHAALLCVQSGSTLDDPKRFKFEGEEFYLKIARADAAHLPRQPRGVRQHARDRRAGRRPLRHERQLHAALPGPGRRDRAELVRQGGRARACTRGIRPASRPRCARGPTSRPASSCRWASPATSSSSPTSSTGPRRTASGSVPAAARAPARWPPTRCASPTSIRSSTGCSSSGSSTPTASRCPTSTSTSTTGAAARSSSTSPRSTATSASRRSSPTARSRPSRR